MKSPKTLAEACAEMYTDKLEQYIFYNGAMTAVKIIMSQGNGSAKTTATVCKALVDEVAGWLETRLGDVT